MTREKRKVNVGNAFKERCASVLVVHERHGRVFEIDAMSRNANGEMRKRIGKGEPFCCGDGKRKEEKEADHGVRDEGERGNRDGREVRSEVESSRIAVHQPS